MTTINFQTNGTFSGPVYAVDGVTITGSGDVVDGNLALGIGVGRFLPGLLRSDVDKGETIVFAFDSGAATDVSYNLGGYSYDVLARIEAFGVNGNSLGTVEQVGTFDSINVSQLFGGVAISKFQLTGSVGHFNIKQLGFTPATLNNPPTATNDSNTTNEDTAVAGNVSTNDTDPNPTDTLSVSAVNGVAASVGNQITLASGAKLTLNSDGTYSYNPNGQFESLGAGQTDSDSFTYTVSDGKGGTSDATVELTITGVNDAPVAVNDSVTAFQNTPLKIANSTLIANDTDVDSPASSLQITGVSGATNGTVSLNNNGTPNNFADDFITFTPNNGFSGNASFSYTLSDGSLSSTATVQVVVGRNINGGNGNDTLTGTAANDVINGQNGQDTLYGLAGNDRIDGGNGDDKLYGGAGKDTLLGGNGNDLLWGDAGDDLLTGGNGSDTFAIGKTLGIDTITDFSLGQGDKIGLLDGLTFNQLTFSGNQILAGSEVLAVVTGFNTNTFTAANFVSI